MRHIGSTLPVVARSAVVLLATCLASPAKADEPGAQVQTQAAIKSAYEHKLICKREAVVGSYVRTLRCRTQAQIDQERAATKLWAENMRNGSTKALPGLRGPDRYRH